MKEIGSEFEYTLTCNCEEETSKHNGIFVYSGRTAIYNLLKVLKADRHIGTVWIPSYCCKSMIEPIEAIGLNYNFYIVNYVNGKITRDIVNVSDKDIVISLEYFGFYDQNNELFVEHCKSKGALIIEDCTHSYLRNKKSLGDYSIVSLRKWFPVASGGLIAGNIKKEQLGLAIPNDDIIEIRKTAMKEKAGYLSGNSCEKECFLNKYSSFNNSFIDNYSWTIDDWSYQLLTMQDIPKIREKRLKNAETLINGLKRNSHVEILFSLNKTTDCPIFVPILIEKREALHSYLVKNKVYCPIHWPKPDKNAISNFYEKEISLVCDQRYTIEDMERIVHLINSFYEE